MKSSRSARAVRRHAPGQLDLPAARAAEAPAGEVEQRVDVDGEQLGGRGAGRERGRRGGPG